MTELTTTEGMAQSLLPYYTDGGRKASYLSYLIAGFSVMESVKLSKIAFKSVKRWREDDPSFVMLEAQSRGELRKRLSDEVLDIEFTRNFRLVMAKDFRILYKDAQELMLTESEEKYLALIRKFYTPEQLARIKEIIGGGGQSEAFDWTKEVITFRIEREEKSARG